MGNRQQCHKDETLVLSYFRRFIVFQKYVEAEYFGIQRARCTKDVKKKYFYFACNEHKGRFVGMKRRHRSVSCCCDETSLC